MIRILGMAAAGMSTGLLAAAFLLERVLFPGIVVLVFGILWIAAWVLTWKWVADIGLVFTFLIASVGILYTYGSSFLGTFRNLDPGLLFGCLPFALASWDLADLDARVRYASPQEDSRQFIENHLLRLFLLLGLGMVLVWAAIHTELEISFELIVILMLFVIWGIGRVASRLLRK